MLCLSGVIIPQSESPVRMSSSQLLSIWTESQLCDFGRAASCRAWDQAFDLTQYPHFSMGFRGPGFGIIEDQVVEED